VTLVGAALLVVDLVSIGLIGVGAVFFVAGTVGLLRFPDLYTRMHSLTKADNVGLGLIVGGLALQSTSFSAVAQILIIWLLVLLSSASGAHLLVRDARRRGRRPWVAR
jgi:multicomponent Na+:H+ antiporter subunit G